MLTIFRAFCVVSCFVSGVYCSIFYHHFKEDKRMIWFAALCFSLCINVNQSIAFFPHMLLDTGYTAGIRDNIYLASFALTTMCLNIYSGFIMDSKFAIFHSIYNYACFILAALCMLIPDSFTMTMFLILGVFSMFTYIFSISLTLKKFIEGEKYYIFPSIAYWILFIVSLIGYVLLMLGYDFTSPRVACTPVLLILHGIMLTRQYQTSLSKTRKLSASLSDTIERINHSDNALMCTQMKADFLYKSLDLISHKCDEDPFVAEDLTVSLSKYLRHTLNFQQLQGIVPLQNEIELTKSFISIEKAKNTNITFEYKFPDPLPDFYIPPLSIQPLVENAIEHGFSEDCPNPKITITIIPYRDYFHIDVSDNGTGMEEEMIDSLTESLHDTARIGIYNIHSRLIGLFGKGLVIQSAPGVGTSVSFVVPPDAIAYLKEKEAANQ